MEELKGFTNVGDCIRIALGDAIECLRNIPNGSVDFIITDPPYNLGLFMKKRGTNMNKLRNGHFAASGWDDLCFEDWTKQMGMFLKECHRVLKKKGNLIIFMSIIKVETLINLAQDSGFYYKTVGIWHKTNPLPRNMNLQFVNSTETWVYMVNDGTTGTFNNEGKVLHDFVETATISNKERKHGKHPTQKPIGLMKHFIGILCNEGETVLDPFMGSGSTGVACKELNRNFIGIELNESYFELSRKRIEEA